MRGLTVILIAVFGTANAMYDSCEGNSGQPTEEKIWTMQVTHDWGPQGYLDEGGYLQGSTLDLVTEVCSAARIKCRTVWDLSSNCWDSQPGQHATGGKGLLDGYYDACIGWTPTVGRQQVFDFSLPFFAIAKIFFYKRKSSSFDPEDVSGKTIGFRDGWFSDEKCLARQNIRGVPIDADRVKYYGTSEQMANDLKSGIIDGIFITDHSIQEDDDIEKIASHTMACSSAGDAVMTRKDSDFNSHWNRGFQQIVSSGRFSRICDEIKNKHGHKGDAQPCA